jgi:glycogen debranching enzyme
MDPGDGLISSGDPGTQLTWMDAKVGSWVVTPRHGCPVEVNALWYNALCIMQQLAAVAEPALAGEFQANAAKTNAAFQASFWFEAGGYLYDVVTADVGRDASLRPNQVYALSLPFRLLTGIRAQQVLGSIERHLLTGYGLRTLSPEHADFRPTYAGGPVERDGAYHQGTVWPFLLGEYLLAYLQVNGHSAATHTYVRKAMAPLLEHFTSEGCIEGTAEIFDGAEPREGKGTMHQAWSASTLLQVKEALDKSTATKAKKSKA